MLFYPYFCTNLHRFLHFEKGFFCSFLICRFSKEQKNATKLPNCLHISINFCNFAADLVTLE